MGLFDRKSTTTNLQDITNRNIAAENLNGQSVIGSENVNILDGGAISGIANVARNAIDNNRGLASESLDFGRTSLLSVGAAFEQAGNATQKIFETATGRGPSVLTDDTVKIGVVALAIVAGLYFWNK